MASKEETTTKVEMAPEEHAEIAKDKASEAATAAGESATEASKAAKDKLSEAGETTAQATAHAAEATKESTLHAKDVAVDYAHVATEKASELEAAAKQKLTEAGETVTSGVQSAFGFIKEHLPRVEHVEESEEEKRSKALLDEAMGRPEEHVAAAETKTAVTEPVVEVRQVGGPPKESFMERTARTADEALGAPVELKERMHAEAGGGVQGDERSAKGLMEALGEKMEHMSYGDVGGDARDLPLPDQHQNPPRMHEYTALPGDIHVPLITKAIREKILHKPAETTTHHPEEYTSTVQTSSTPPTSEGVLADARRRAADATKTAEAKTEAVAHSVGDTLSQAYHKVADPLSEAVHTAEEKVKWGYGHTKEELLDKTSAETHAEMQPHNAYEAELAHGGIPSSTDKVIKSDVTVGGAATDTKLAPSTPTAGTVGGKDAETVDALAKSTEGYGADTLAPPDTTDLAKESVSLPGSTAHAKERSIEGDFSHRHPHLAKFSDSLKDATHDMDVKEPGSEGEIPS